MNGEDCKCAARCESECGCGVDWRTANEIKGERLLATLKDMNERMEAAIKEAEYEPVECWLCNGSGEGRGDGATCSECKGLGVTYEEAE
jgi:DnaJ-class molecular chaperone